MTTDGLTALREQLGAEPPASLERLEDTALADLAQAVRAARRHQAAELQKAGDQALGHIPWVFRGPIKKLLG
jgi:hypothetical protein